MISLVESHSELQLRRKGFRMAPLAGSPICTWCHVDRIELIGRLIILPLNHALHLVLLLSKSFYYLFPGEKECQLYFVDMDKQTFSPENRPWLWLILALPIVLSM